MRRKGADWQGDELGADNGILSKSTTVTGSSSNDIREHTMFFSPKITTKLLVGDELGADMQLVVILVTI